NQLSTVGIIANLAAVPLAGAATVLGLLAVVAAAVGDLAAAAAFGAVWPLLLLLRAVAALAAAVPGAVIRLPAPGAGAVIAYAAGLGGALAAWRWRARRGPCRTLDAGAGGPWRLDAGERAVAPFLWNRGVLALHATLTTHADIDHAGGMAALRRLFAVTESWDDAARPRSVGGALLTPIVPDVPGGRRNDRATML